MRRKFGLLALLFCFAHVRAQQPLMLWNGASAQYKAGKNWNFECGIQNRWDFAEQVIAQQSFSGEIEFGGIKKINLLANYRWSRFPNNHSEINQEQWASANRLGIGAEWKIFKTFIKNSSDQLNYRALLQSETALFKRDKNILRQRLLLKPDIRGKKWNPFVSAEFFYRFNANQYWIDDQLVVQGAAKEWRWTVGISYKINDRNKLQISASYRDFQNNKTDCWVANLDYSFNINPKKKMKTAKPADSNEHQ
jgi:hypothetical protein